MVYMMTCNLIVFHCDSTHIWAVLWLFFKCKFNTMQSVNMIKYNKLAKNLWVCIRLVCMENAVMEKKCCLCWCHLFSMIITCIKRQKRMCSKITLMFMKIRYKNTAKMWLCIEVKCWFGSHYYQPIILTFGRVSCNFNTTQYRFCLLVLLVNKGLILYWTEQIL